MHECNLIPVRGKGSEDDEVWMSFAKKVDVLTMSRNLLLLFRKKMLHPISRTGYLQERKRALKPQGPSKIDGKCSAFMKVVVDSVSKEVNVEYNLFHIGHDTRLGHL